MHLLEVCSSNSWARNVLAGGPFRDVDALLDRGRVDNAGSAREQAAVATAGDDVRAELAAKNRAYEDTFGYGYLVCASGRFAKELLAT